METKVFIIDYNLADLSNKKTRQRPGLVYYNFEPNNLTVLTICAV